MISGKQICKKPKKDIIQQENYLKIVFLPLYLAENNLLLILHMQSFALFFINQTLIPM